MEKKVREKKA
jgi:hypothetical protein